MRAEAGVGLVQPCGEADAAGDGVELGDGEGHFFVGARLGEDDVWADDAGDVVAEFFLAGVFDEFGGLAGVEVIGDPAGLLALDAHVVEEIAGAVEEVQAVAEFLQFLEETPVDGEGLRGDEPFLVGEEALGGHCGADGGDFIEVGEH